MLLRLLVILGILLCGSQELFSKNPITKLQKKSQTKSQTLSRNISKNITNSFRKDGLLSFTSRSKPTSKKIARKITGEITINIEIAESDQARSQGLMYRDKLAQNSGMFFLFDNEALRYFYMRDTKISLDIIFVNTQKKIVHIRRNAVPYSLEILPSKIPARYAIEVNAGFCEKHGIAVGDCITFKRV